MALDRQAISVSGYMCRISPSERSREEQRQLKLIRLTVLCLMLDRWMVTSELPTKLAT